MKRISKKVPGTRPVLWRGEGIARHRRTAALLFLALLSAAVLCWPAYAAGPSDYPVTNAQRVNNVDLLGRREGDFANGNRIVAVAKSSPVEVSFTHPVLRGWSVSMEGVAGFYYQMGFVKANGTVDLDEPVAFEGEVREDVLAANPEYAEANPDARVGIQLVLPVYGMKAGVYQFDVWAVTRAEKRYQVLKGYVTLAVNYNVNGDGVLDIRDAIAYRQILANDSSYNSLYDFNGDGACDEIDYAELLYAVQDRYGE